MTRFRRGRAGLLCVAVVGLAACGSHSADPIRHGAGGIKYQWPPPDGLTSGPPSPARFCQLLIDDYQHLKTTGQAHGTAALVAITSDYVSFAPTLEAAAPQSIAPDAKVYVNAVSNLLRAMDRDSFNVLAVPPGLVTILNGPAVSAAYSALSAFSDSKCHYDLAANTTGVRLRS